MEQECRVTDVVLIKSHKTMTMATTWTVRPVLANVTSTDEREFTVGHSLIQFCSSQVGAARFCLVTFGREVSIRAGYRGFLTPSTTNAPQFLILFLLNFNHSKERRRPINDHSTTDIVVIQ